MRKIYPLNAVGVSESSKGGFMAAFCSAIRKRRGKLSQYDCDRRQDLDQSI